MTEHITIGDISPRIQYAGDGTQTVFTYPFPVFASDNIAVYLDDELQGSGYSVAGAGEKNGGTVTFDTAPPDGTTVTLERRLVIERISDFAEGGAFRAVVINNELDYQTAVIQQIAEDVGRAVTRAKTSTSTAELILPEPVAGKALCWNGDGDGLTNSTNNIDTIVTQATTARLAAEDAQTAAVNAQTAAETAQTNAQDSATVAASYANTAAAAVAGVNLPLAVADTYIKQKSDGSGYKTVTTAEVAADALEQYASYPADTQVKKVAFQETTGTTASAGGSVEACSFTYIPRLENSRLLVSVTAKSMSASYDYGSSHNTDINGSCSLLIEGTEKAGASVGGKGYSQSDGDAAFHSSVAMQGIFDVTDETSITIAVNVNSAAAGYTTSLYANSSNPITIFVEEVSQ